MASSNRNTNGQFMFSPAEGLADIPSPGSHSNPGAPSIHPNISLTDKSGDSAPMSSPAESYAGMSETVSSGGASGAVLANGPSMDGGAGLGQELAAGIGQVPKPSGSY